MRTRCLQPPFRSMTMTAEAMTHDYNIWNKLHTGVKTIMRRPLCSSETITPSHLCHEISGVLERVTPSLLL